MPRFLMLPPIDETRRQWAERLRADVPELQVAIAESAADLPSQIAEADAAFGWVPPDTLPTATKLRWLQNPDAGPFIGYYYDALVEHPVVVCNPRGVYSDHIAHHILMFILALSRGLPDWISAQRQRQWDRGARQSPYVDIASSTVLINGMGGIGQETARLLYNMGASIVGVDPRPASDSEFEIIDPSLLDARLSDADFVVTTVPHTPATEGMWHRQRFQLMKSSAYFINIGRGKTAVLADLIAALQNNEIAGAGLDVFETEPLPPENPLWAMRNVLITPHAAVMGATNVEERRYQILLENAKRFCNGQPLLNVVDKRVWY